MQRCTLLVSEITPTEKEERVMADINSSWGENDAQALKQAFGIDTVRELADNNFVRIAQAITSLSR